MNELMRRPLKTRADVEFFVDEFYARARADADLGPVFEAAIGDQWPKHLAKMYDFWQTVLHDEHTYFGSPFKSHAALPIGEKHFEKWLGIFHATLDAHFEGAEAEDAKIRAAAMAKMFQYKLAYIRAHPGQKLM